MPVNCTVKPPKSGQPLYSRRLTCPRLITLRDRPRTNRLRTSEKRTPQLRTTDADQPPMYLSQMGGCLFTQSHAVPPYLVM